MRQAKTTTGPLLFEYGSFKRPLLDLFWLVPEIISPGKWQDLLSQYVGSRQTFHLIKVLFEGYSGSSQWRCTQAWDTINMHSLSCEEPQKWEPMGETFAF